MLAIPAWGQINYPDFSSVAGLNLNGSAAQFGSRLRLTDSSGFQLGTAWYTKKQYVQNGFETRFQFQITDTGYTPGISTYPQGGNGFSFTIQNSAPNAIGNKYDMGYDSLANCVSVEFDVAYNPLWGDPNDNHVSIQTRGVLPNSDTTTYSLGLATPLVRMNNGSIYLVIIDYNIMPGMLRVFLNDTVNPLLIVPLDLTNVRGGNILDNGTAWVGFTAGTGAGKENHDILNWTFNSSANLIVTNSYIIPDIGTPGMNTYMEIVGPYNRDGNFGNDGFYTNNPGDAVQVVCANPADTNKVKIGPVEVSWNGKLISTQMFVMPGEQPNSDDWRQLGAAYKIPLSVIVNGSTAILPDTFYIVQPQPAIVSNIPGVIGSGGGWGFRSRRGAMIVDSMVLTGAGTYTIDTSDCDPGTAGNQGYLPVTILSKGGITLLSGATLSVSSFGENAGPGGGGGGLGDGPVGEIGGNGYTGGGTGEAHSRPATGGDGTGSVGSATQGGNGLDGLPGSPSDVLCCQSPGGSGNPYVVDGGGVAPPNASKHEGDGPGGGFGTAGQDAIGQRGTDNFLGGVANGNPMLVPLMGGSGGGGGNEFCAYAPSGLGATGAGGGGALMCYGKTITSDSIISSGGVGTTSGIGCVGHGSYGGCGSGGGISVEDKLGSNIGNITVEGAVSPHATDGGGSGGAGRARLDGPQLSNPTVTPIQASQYRGPSTDTSMYVTRTFTLTGTGNGQPVNIYIKPETGAWQLAATVSNYPSNPWSQTITLPGNDSLYFLVAAQQAPNPDTARYTMEPSWVFSQAAANILHVTQNKIVTTLQNSYIIPDIGTPGMNTYMEIVGPYNQDGNFGSDGFYANNPGDAVQVVCANPADTNKVKIGPVEVSWNGKLISTQMFVMPGEQPNSDDWRQLGAAYKIPLSVIVNGAVSMLPDTFYIVQPQPAIISNIAGVIGSGGGWGFRSRRGAMIVDSMVLSGAGTYTVDTSDCDPMTPGNQGYLPVTILSKGTITISSSATLSVDGNGINGGPGGAGGGGAFNDYYNNLGNPVAGGNGYTGGEGGTVQGGNGSGGNGRLDSTSLGGISLNGVPGGSEKPGAYVNDYGPGSQGAGGGTGFPFGTGGQGGYLVECDTTDAVGGYSGGSGCGGCAGGIYQAGTSFGGGGGGNATAGTSTTTGGGFVSGNNMLVPVSGGSGGSGGNPWNGVAGVGGGGGGALSVYGDHLIFVSNINSNGAKGGDATLQTPGKYSSAGGAGSGGGVLAMSKLSVDVGNVSVIGGKGGTANPLNPTSGTIQNGGDGGAGRARFDGPQLSNPTVTPIQASQYRGPSTDTSAYVTRTFTLTGTGNGQPINIYVKPETGAWQLAAAVSNYPSNPWSQSITLPGSDSLYFLVAAQKAPNPNTAQYTMEPSWVFSQAAANILHVSGAQKNRTIAANVAGFDTLVCDTVTFSNVTINNAGTDTLHITNITITQNNEGFSVAASLAYPIILLPGADTVIRIRFAPATPGSKTAVLNIYSDAVNSPILILPLSGQRNSVGAITATVAVTADSGKPGDTVYLPVVVRSLQQGALSGMSYTARVSYNGGILLPVGMRNGTIDSIGNGYVLFTCNNATDTAVLICIVGLGDSTSTAVMIDTVEWGGCAVQSTFVNGAFQLKGLCTQGGTRLFVVNGQLTLSQNAPNPFSGETVIRYGTIEDGETRLRIADMLGRTVAVPVNAYQKAGSYSVSYNGAGLQTGLYLYILQTPTQIVRRTMMVEK